MILRTGSGSPPTAVTAGGVRVEGAGAGLRGAEPRRKVVRFGPRMRRLDKARQPV
jgi:hypothetical protein